MKKIIFTFLILTGFLQTNLAQEVQALKEQEIRSLFYQNKYHEVIIALDSFDLDYTENPLLQMLRVNSWLQLNDMINFSKDLSRAIETNPVLAARPNLRVLTDKQYLAELITREHVSDAVPDPGREYKPLLTTCDTIRGALRQARSCFDVTFYDLSLSVYPKDQRIEGKNKIFFTVTESTNVIQLDLFDSYQILSITMNGEALNYFRICQAVFIEVIH